MSGMQYSQEQAEQWLEHIGLPKDFRPEHVPGKDLEALARIQKYHLSKVPFENLQIHYTPEHIISIDPEYLFQRVVKRSLGGYCMQANLFFELMLRTLGFQVYSTGARGKGRVNGRPVGAWQGWGHQVIIATLADGHRYMVDVGYGGDCIIEPLRLEEGRVWDNIGSLKNRLVRESLGVDQSQKMWVYQLQYEAGGEWHSTFAFSELEFLPADFNVMNYWVCRDTWFVDIAVGVKFLREGEDIIGKYTLAKNIFKMNIKGNVSTLLGCKDDAERVAGLEEYFGIKLNEDEVAAVKGWRGEVKSASQN